MAKDLYPPFLCPTIQAFLPARRPQSVCGEPFAQRGMADAQRCTGRAMAKGVRKFVKNTCKILTLGLPLMYSEEKEFLFGA